MRDIGGDRDGALVEQHVGGVAQRAAGIDDVVDQQAGASLHVAAALAAVTAAVVGVVANLALWFGLHVLFGEVGEAPLGPLVLPAPDVSTFNPAAALIALATGVALLRFHVGVVPALLCAAIAGMTLRLFP